MRFSIPHFPDEPLIFIEAALTAGILGYVRPLLDPQSAVDDPAEARCAIFYSITNCQTGLRGVSFGNFLIKQVVEDLSREFRKIRKFATLSPVPGFRSWLMRHRELMSPPLSALTLDSPAVADRCARLGPRRDHAALRVLSASRQARTRAARSGRAVSPRERRPPGEAQLGRRRLVCRHRVFTRDYRELCVSNGGRRREPRGVRERLQSHDLVLARTSCAASSRDEPKRARRTRAFPCAPSRARLP